MYIKTQENILRVVAKYEKCNALFYVGIYTVSKNLGSSICSAIRHCP
jgi:hypothetical protein